MMQVYWVGVRGGDTAARPGQFVFMNDADTTVRGFIGEVDPVEERVLVYLFEPVPVEDFAEVVHERIDDQVWADKLAAAINANPAMRQAWTEHLMN